MLSQREKFVCYVASTLNALEGQEVSDDFYAALLEVLREGKCDELSTAETKDILNQIVDELKDSPQIIKDIMKKLG